MSAIPEDENVPHLHICDGCGAEELLTTEDAYQKGWDYPPMCGPWGTLAARTCPNCGVQTSAWWSLAVDGKSFAELSEHHQNTVRRVRAEAEELEQKK